MRFVTALVVMLAVASFAGGRNASSAAKRDLAALCAVAEAHVATHGLANERYADFAHRLSDVKLEDPTVVEGRAAFLNAVPDRRYGFLEEAAKKTGQTGWSCDALKKLATVPGV